jgi:hypothetical protein
MQTGETRKAPQTRGGRLTDFKVQEMPKVLAITTAGFSIPRKDLVG